MATEQGKKQASVEFVVAGNKKVLWRNGVMKAGIEPDKRHLICGCFE